MLSFAMMIVSPVQYIVVVAPLRLVASSDTLRTLAVGSVPGDADAVHRDWVPSGIDEAHAFTVKGRPEDQP